MLETLNFIKGAVAKKDFVPVLTHVHIKDGYIQAYNGVVTLCSPIDLDLDCTPRADKFLTAIKTCRDTVKLSITPTGLLSVKSKGFNTRIPCTTEPFPSVELQGERIDLPGTGFLPALAQLEPMIAEDASRPWARGILLDKRCAFATNNVVIAQKWLEFSFPVRINLPHMAVNELLRIKKEPVAMIINETTATFIYDDDRWMRTQLNSNKWPDIDKMFNERAKGTPTDIPEGFFDALRDVAPFTDDLRRVFISEGKVMTSEVDEIATVGEVDGLMGSGCYNVDQLLLIEGVAQKLDFTNYPNPCLFLGDKLRGAVVGVKA